MRLHRQDGFIRGVLWLALIVAIAAVALLDGMAVFRAHQSAGDDAATAAREARDTYAVSQDVASAKYAARQYLLRADDRMPLFVTARMPDDKLLFTVSARSHADTYAFKYLAHVPGLRKWVESATDPTETRSSQ
jgi:hypothetical protein